MDEPNRSEPNLGEAVNSLTTFMGIGLTERLAAMQSQLLKTRRADLKEILHRNGVTADALIGAFQIKRLAAENNTALHALGILLLLQEILEEDEVIEYTSLGAGNNGGGFFDLQTTKRIAEFKFINWRGGPEAVRQDSLFKDLVGLAEWKRERPLTRELFVLEADAPLNFLHGRRRIESVLRRHPNILVRYPEICNYETVGDYYRNRCVNFVTLRVASQLSNLFSVW